MVQDSAEGHWALGIIATHCVILAWSLHFTSQGLRVQLIKGGDCSRLDGTGVGALPGLCCCHCWSLRGHILPPSYSLGILLIHPQACRPPPLIDCNWKVKWNLLSIPDQIISIIPLNFQHFLIFWNSWIITSHHPKGLYLDSFSSNE